MDILPSDGEQILNALSKEALEEAEKMLKEGSEDIMKDFGEEFLIKLFRKVTSDRSFNLEAALKLLVKYGIQFKEEERNNNKVFNTGWITTFKRALERMDQNKKEKLKPLFHKLLLTSDIRPEDAITLATKCMDLDLLMSVIKTLKEQKVEVVSVIESCPDDLLLHTNQDCSLCLEDYGARLIGKYNDGMAMVLELWRFGYFGRRLVSFFECKQKNV